jgi:hypothetical protein
MATLFPGIELAIYLIDCRLLRVNEALQREPVLGFLHQILHRVAVASGDTAAC